MSNGLFLKTVKGTETVDLTAYKGHLCLITANIDSNGFLSLSGIFIINQRSIENFTSCQYDTAASTSISLVNNSGKYHLGSALWGTTDYVNNTSVTYRIF